MQLLSNCLNRRTKIIVGLTVMLGPFMEPFVRIIDMAIAEPFPFRFAWVVRATESAAFPDPVTIFLS